MGSIRISSEEKDTFSRISNNFIDYYMADANGDFVKVYMYLLRLFTGNKPVSISGIADHLSCTEADVMRAIKYWIGKDVLKTIQNEDGSVGLVIASLSSPKLTIDEELALLHSEKAEKDSIDLVVENTYAAEESTFEEKKPKVSRPKVTRAKLKAMNEDPLFHELTMLAQAYFNRPLTQSDFDLLVHVYDELGFSFELCEYLLEYCADKQPVKVSYVTKIAQDWHEHQFTTKEDAQYYTMRFFSLYGSVMRELGMRSSDGPAPEEKKLIDYWAKDLDFDDAIILEACKRAVLKNKKTLSYVNGILKKWHEADVKKISDIFALDKKHEEELTMGLTSARPRKKPSISDIKQDDLSNELFLIEQLSMPKKP